MIRTTIDDIPDPLLRNILASCLLIQAHLPPQSCEPRVVFPSVCSKWRNIIAATPAFWKDIVFNPLPSFKNPLNLFTLANAWLIRSGNLPLSIQFSEELQFNKEEGSKPKYLAHFLFGGSVNFNAFCSQIISTHAARIRQLTCKLITKTTITSFLSLPPEFFRNLEVLNIQFIDEITLPSSLKGFTAAEQANFTLFCSQPRLQIVSLEVYNGNGIRPLYLRFPWHQLTNLIMDKTPICPEYFLKLLKKTSPSLVDGFFNIVFSGHSIKTPPSGCLNHVCIPRLESLRLRLFNPSTDPRIFNVVRLPALKRLWLEMIDDKKGWSNLGLYKSLLLHSTNTLQTLSLWNPADVEPRKLKEDERSLLRRTLKLQALLQVANNVDTLCLPAGVYIDSTILTKISTGVLLPFLTYLKVSATSVSPASVFDVVGKRYENFICASKMSSTSRGHNIVPPFSLFSVDLTAPQSDEERTASRKGRGTRIRCYQCYGVCIRVVDR